MAQVVVSDPLHADDFGGAIHRFLTLTNAHDGRIGIVIPAVLAQPLQKVLHVRYHGNFPHFARHTPFQPGLRIAAHHDPPSLEIHIGPCDVARFMDAKTTIGKKTNQVRTVPAITHPVVLDLLDEGIELVMLRQAKLFGTLRGTLDETDGLS